MSGSVGICSATVEVWIATETQSRHEAFSLIYFSYNMTLFLSLGKTGGSEVCMPASTAPPSGVYRDEDQTLSVVWDEMEATLSFDSDGFQMGKIQGRDGQSDCATGRRGAEAKPVLFSESLRAVRPRLSLQELGISLCWALPLRARGGE